MMQHALPHKYDLVVGIDVDAKSYVITDSNHMSKKTKQFLKMPAKPENLYNHYQKLYPNHKVLYAYEAGPTGYHLHDELHKMGQNCLLVNPASIQVARNDRVKTNRIDSKKICEQVTSGQLKGIHVPTEDYRHLRHLISLRQRYASDQRRAKQRIGSFLLFEHIIIPELECERWSGKHIKNLKGLELKDVHRFKLDALLSDLEYARRQLVPINRKLRLFIKEHKHLYKDLDLLKTVPGFGFVIPIYVLARIGSLDNLRHLGSLAGLAGLGPSEKSTGDKIHKGPITHMGDRVLRSLLVEAAWVAIRHDKSLAQTYHRIKSKHIGKGDGAKKIAIIAIARKLTTRVYRVLKDQKPYIIQ